jgi:hypothetical protein
MEIKPDRLACGEFAASRNLHSDDLERPGMAVVPRGISYTAGMFAMRGLGPSMEPKIPDGWWCTFDRNVTGTRQNRLVLVEDLINSGFTLKKYRSRKVSFLDDTWSHEEISLHPLNRAHTPIYLDSAGRDRICGSYVDCVQEIKRIDSNRYQHLPEDELHPTSRPPCAESRARPREPSESRWRFHGERTAR